MSDDVVELRGLAPRKTVDVLDAVALARKVSRTDIVNEVLAEWAADRVHESKLVLRVIKREGTVKEPSGSAE
jgi:hypothetical protein